MKTNIKITAVVFDTDGDEDLNRLLQKNTIGNIYTVEHDADSSPLDAIADVVSDDTGWCIERISGIVV